MVRLASDSRKISSSKQTQSSSKITEQIAKELGVSYFTISRWKRQLDLKRKPTYTEHPELSDVKISKRLNINNSNMWKWRQQFVNKNANAESSANDERPKKKQLVLRHVKTMPTGIAWKWNRCTKERKTTKMQKCVLN
uniref:Transposase n=1 Tax=Globodera rostochiensis TaxID=31243 RepID=A0A914HEB4_GLORO